MGRDDRNLHGSTHIRNRMGGLQCDSGVLVPRPLAECGEYPDSVPHDSDLASFPGVAKVVEDLGGVEELVGVRVRLVDRPVPVPHGDLLSRA